MDLTFAVTPEPVLLFDPSFLSHAVTGDDTWAYADDTETKQQSSQWKKHSVTSIEESEISQEQKIKSGLISFFF